MRAGEVAMSPFGALLGRHEQPVHRVTDAPVSLDDDLSGRSRRYVMSMVLRIVLILAAVVASGWLRWCFALGAVFIPYFAVVIANGGRSRESGAVTFLDSTASALPPAASDTASPVADD
ncbi:MAG: DUF3099 domain-containing protein [Actinomycetes bacterium]